MVQAEGSSLKAASFSSVVIVVLVVLVGLGGASHRAFGRASFQTASIHFNITLA